MRTYDIRGAGSFHLPLPAEEQGSDPTEGCIDRFPKSGPYNKPYQPCELLETFATVRQDGTLH
ncbi:hypothetical protein BT69DRAFT_1279740 [Atractiella rhizophila]|nr:hypothetical protein BT69DRAFT_1279740 [Atractiella rhizophila]